MWREPVTRAVKRLIFKIALIAAINFLNYTLIAF